MQKIITIILILICNLTLGQEKIYRLISKTENADVNYSAFKKFIDFEIKTSTLRNAFQPVKGDYNVYFFIAKFKGDSFDGTQKMFHDYLVLKVDPKSKLIVDGFQYTMEWAEPPAISDLYKVTKKGHKLTDGFELNLLKMELVEKENIFDWRKELKDNGVLTLN